MAFRPSNTCSVLQQGIFAEELCTIELGWDDALLQSRVGRDSPDTPSVINVINTSFCESRGYKCQLLNLDIL